jgi:hypothetical protein
VHGILPPCSADTSDVVYRVSQGFPAGEYLLIENRQPVGFDAKMPRGGIAIYHVDETMLANPGLQV